MEFLIALVGKVLPKVPNHGIEAIDSPSILSAEG